MGLEKKDAMNRARWRVGVREITAGVNPATLVYGDKPRSKDKASFKCNVMFTLFPCSVRENDPVLVRPKKLKTD